MSPRSSTNWKNDLVVLDRVDEAVAQPVADAEDLVEPGEPGAALGRGAAREVRGVDRCAALGELTEPVEPRRGEQLRARGEIEPRVAGNAVSLAHELDREIGLSCGDVRLEQVVAEVLPECRLGDRVAAVSGRATFEMIRERLGPGRRWRISVPRS